MTELNLISQLEENLKAFIKLIPVEPVSSQWQLEVQLFYAGESAGKTSFNLYGYNQEEAEAIARGVKQNSFLMKEIDEYLWGDSD
ncbi:hypothetical protein [Gynuella sp.]|uniref:hypothetical protein n=1 Tax=Gynuella sp. TaxID=2969146 RepID=UPI003D10F4F0